MAESEKAIEEISNVTDGGNPVRRRIPSAKIAHATFKRAKDEQLPLAMMRAQIQGIYDGHPPLSQAEMRRRGFAWMSNLDWGEFRSSMNLGAAAIWNMLAGAGSLITLETDFVDEDNPGKNYGRIVAKEFTRTVKKKWRSFHWRTLFRLLEMLKFGSGTMFWRDEYDWRSHPVRVANLIIPSNASSDVTELDVFFIRDEMSVYDLMDDIVKDTAENDGWNVAYLKKILNKIYNDHMQKSNERYQGSDWESWYQSYKNQSYTEQPDFEKVRVVHVLSREVNKTDEDNEISHQIIYELDDEKKGEFLFENERRFGSVWNVVSFLLFHIGDGYQKSVRGLGKEEFSIKSASNRLLNSILDGVKMRAGLMLKAASAEAQERFDLFVKGPATVIPEGFQAQQQNVVPEVGSAVQARQLFQNLSNNNTGAYKAVGEGGGLNARTATEAEIQASRETRFENIQADWYYVQWGWWLEETFRRLMNPEYPESAGGYKEHKEFIDRLKKKNVPEKLLNPDAWDVYPKKTIGLGSQTMRLLMTNQLAQYKSAMDETGRQEVDREYVAARVGEENVDRFIHEKNLDDIPMYSHAMADSESVDMKQGNPRIVPVDDLHKIHVDHHFRNLADIIKPFMAGDFNGVEQAFIAVQLFIDHITKHLEYLEDDPTREVQVEAYREQIKVAERIAGQMKQVVAQLQQQRQKQQEEQQKMLQEAEEILASREVEIERIKAENLKEVEMYKAKLLDDARKSKTNTANEAKLASLEADMQAKFIALESEIRRKDRETNAKIARESREGGTQ